MDLHDPNLWVAVGFVILVASVCRPAGRALAAMLDGRTEAIRKSLDEAASLREDAQRLRTEYQRKQRDAAKETAAMIERARADAERISKEGAAKIEESMKRRERAALEKIARAEAEALREVRAASIDIALAATRHLIASRMDQPMSDAMIDDAIANLH